MGGRGPLPPPPTPCVDWERGGGGEEPSGEGGEDPVVCVTLQRYHRYYFDCVDELFLFSLCVCCVFWVPSETLFACMRCSSASYSLWSEFDPL